MKIKAITPLGEFQSISLNDDESEEILRILRNSHNVVHITLPISGDRKTGVVLPCDTVKNSVFVIEFPLEDEKE